MKNDGGPAFPCPVPPMWKVHWDEEGNEHTDIVEPTGMSLLDYFAGCEEKRDPCQYCNKPKTCRDDQRAGCFYDQAEAMLAERERRMKGETK
ncbi:hypothetical protein LCGC14_0552310 [marine sediment metagenome]|uniref:Uncharacterized protein n=1 Tax=marine sediment metagenome TaxID=412755 RepID=A0A0F9UXT3_9ZZZZ